MDVLERGYVVEHQDSIQVTYKEHARQSIRSVVIH